MDILIKTLSEVPFIGLFAYLWWVSRKDYITEKKRLIENIKQKDETIKEFSKILDGLTISLELIKDRLR